MTDSRRSALVAGLAVLLAVPVASQVPLPVPPQSDQAESVPTFRASVRYVEVDVDVKVGGQFLTDLTKDDFELFEDGKPQEIDRVTLVDIPAIADAASKEPQGRDAGAQAERTEATRIDDFYNGGRVYVMIFGIRPAPSGAGGTVGSSFGPGAVRALARKFILEYLAPGDLLALVHVGPVRGEGLTSDKARLLAALDRNEPIVNARPPDRYLFSSRYRPPEYVEDRFVSLYRTVKEVAVSLGSITGRRKSIILIGEGEDLWAERDDIHDRWAYVRDATRTAAAFNVPIHTISPNSRMGDLLEDGTEPGRRLLSEYTNGLDLGTVNSADKGFKRLVAQNSRYYILGYYSSLARDGRNHPITVRVKRKRADVSARRGVRTLRPIRMPGSVDLPRVLATTARNALLGKEVAATLPLETSVEVFHGVDYKAALLVQAVVDGLDLDLSPGGKLEFSAAAVDPDGVIRAFDRRAFTLNVRDESHARLERDPLTFFTRLELPPGRYTIRVSAHQPGGATGFQSREIQISDFAERALNLTNVIIASASRSSLILQPDETIRRGLRSAPTLERRFSTSESLAVYAEAFATHWPLISELTVTWSIARGDVVVRRGEETIDVERGGMAYFRGTIPLAALVPGDYLLQADIRATSGPAASARTSLPFHVVIDD
jgi:VWFA-related protein